MRTMLTPILLALAIAAPAAADGCEPGSSDANLTSPACGIDGAPCHYVVTGCTPECSFTLFVYEESNGQPGLQRADEFDDDTCNGAIEADTVVF